MALSKKIGVISCPGSTGNQTISGLGFTPQVVILWSDGGTAAGGSASSITSFGAFDDAANEFVCSGYSQNAVGTANTRRGFNDDYCIRMIASSGTLARASFVSVAAGEFTINWNVVSSGRRVYYCALAGLTDYEVGNFVSATSTGDQDITSPGFESDMLIMATHQSSVIATLQDDYYLSLGFFDGTNQQGVSYWSDDGVSTTNSSTYYDQSNILNVNSAATLKKQASASFLANGFRLNHTTNDAVASQIGYITIKGVDAYVSNTTQKTSVGTQAITGVGFEPEVLLLSHGSLSTGANDDSTPMVAIGIGTGAADQGVIQGYDEDNVGTSDVDRYNNAGYVYAYYDGSLQARADIDSIDSDGFTLNFDTADAVARYIPFLAFKEITPQVSTPVMVPTSGAYQSSQTINITTSTIGADIYFTTNGVDPTSGDTLFTTDIPVFNGTLKAIAIDPLAVMADSDIATEVYTIQAVANQPIITIQT